jgi:hypothetical protein
LGALPLFFEERPRRGRPIDGCKLAISDHYPLDDDPAEFLQFRRRRHPDRLGQRQDPRPIGVERPDPVAVGQRGDIPSCAVAGDKSGSSQH